MFKSILILVFDGNREVVMKVFVLRKVELFLGYFVCCIKRVIDLEEEDGEGGYMLEFEFIEKGVES